jgi:ADP-heptose:LPS heptosyltransferase
MLEVLGKETPDSPLWKESHVYGDAPYRYISACYMELDELKLALNYIQEAIKISPDDNWLKDRAVYIESKINGDVKNFYCYRQGALGDCLMTTAALRGLKEKHPGCHITYVTNEHSMQILEGNKFIDELTVICETPNRGIYFKYPEHMGYPNKPLQDHLIKYFNKCAGVVGDFAMECTLSEKEERTGKTLKGQFKKYVTIHPKAGWSQYKNWYNDRWGEVVEHLFKKGYVTVLLGHIDDPLLVNVVDFRGHSVKEAVAAIKYADLHMGIDSFTNHASVIVETPAVIVFGSTSPTGSGYDQNVNIYKDLECQPCYKEYSSPEQKKVCPFNKKCMDLISVQEVIEAIDKLLP